MARVVRDLLWVGKWWSSLKIVGWEDVFVLDLAVDPSLDVLDVGRSCQSDGPLVGVEPRPDNAEKVYQLRAAIRCGNTHGPADMLGQSFTLQMGTPVVRSSVCTTLTMPASRRFCSTTVND